MICTIRWRWFPQVSRTCVFILALLVLFSSATNAATFKIDCDAGDTIGKALTAVQPGDTVLVTGTCNENLIVQQEVNRITLDGQGRATINGGAADKTHTVIVRGKRVDFKGLTVTGGRDGIHIAGGSSNITDTVIRNVGLNGVFVDHNGFVRLLNNRIEGNRGNGVVLNENSVARIGFNILRDKGRPNTIEGNGFDGIFVHARPPHGSRVP